MSEPSILDYASQPSDVMAEAGQKLQTLISTAGEVATALGRRRAEQAREAAARSEAERRQVKERQKALYEADRLVWRRVWDDRFWDRAIPERIAEAWEACAPWATEGFPAARTTLEHMRAEIRDRYGVEVDPVETRGGDLARLLGAGPQRETETDEGTPEGEPARLETIGYRVRDLDDGTVVASDAVHLGRGEGAGTARLIAAAALTEQETAHPGRRLVVEVVPGGDPHAAGPLLHSLDLDEARTAVRDQRAILAAGREGDVRAAEAEGGAEKVAEALRFEQRRLRSRLREPEPGVDPEEVRAAIADAGLRLRAVEADLRGEDGDLVVRSAVLRAELDEQWWQNATPAEIGAMWNQVGSWAPGAGRDEALDHLRAGVHRQYGTDLPRDASPDELYEALAGPAHRRSRDEDAEASRADETGDRLDRDEPGTALAGGERAWADAQAEAAEQDRAAAAVYDGLAQNGDSQAAEAGRTVSRAFPAKPSARLGRAARNGWRGGLRRLLGRGRTAQRAPRQQADQRSPGR